MSKTNWLLAVIISIATLVAVYLNFFQSSGSKEPKGGEQKEIENPVRLVVITGIIKVQDYELITSNEFASGSFNRTVYVSDAQPLALVQVPPPKICAGDEIYPELDITVNKINASGDVTILIEGRLYEGTSCGTSDLDGTHNSTLFVPANKTIIKSFVMWNTSENEPEDCADITLTFYNGMAP